MSNKRRHDKSPSKQYRPIHAPVGGYDGMNHPTEFQQTGRVDVPGSEGQQDTQPSLTDTFSPMSPLPQDLGPTGTGEASR